MEEDNDTHSATQVEPNVQNMVSQTQSHVSATQSQPDDGGKLACTVAQPVKLTPRSLGRARGPLGARACNAIICAERYAYFYVQLVVSTILTLFVLLPHLRAGYGGKFHV